MSRGGSIVLVARREDRLRALADELGADRVGVFAVDLLDDDAPERIRDHVVERYGRLDLLVNNAGSAWRASFADGGYANVRRTMEINFDAQVRLTEALLGLLRESAPSAIVNVSSTAGRVARAGSGAYSASKFALAGWSDSLWAEERPHGVHVGLVLPGFIATEGFPQSELDGKAADALDRLDARSRRRGDLPDGRRPRARALRAAPLWHRGGAARARTRARAPRARRRRGAGHDDDHRARRRRAPERLLAVSLG